MQIWQLMLPSILATVYMTISIYHCVMDELAYLFVFLQFGLQFLHLVFIFPYNLRREKILSKYLAR